MLTSGTILKVQELVYNTRNSNFSGRVYVPLFHLIQNPQEKKKDSDKTEYIKAKNIMGGLPYVDEQALLNFWKDTFAVKPEYWPSWAKKIESYSFVVKDFYEKEYAKEKLKKIGKTIFNYTKRDLPNLDLIGGSLVNFVSSTPLLSSVFSSPYNNAIYEILFSGMCTQKFDKHKNNTLEDIYYYLFSDCGRNYSLAQKMLYAETLLSKYNIPRKTYGEFSFWNLPLALLLLIAVEDIYQNEFNMAPQGLQTFLRLLFEKSRIGNLFGDSERGYIGFHTEIIIMTSTNKYTNLLMYLVDKSLRTIPRFVEPNSRAYVDKILSENRNNRLFHLSNKEVFDVSRRYV